MVGEHLHWAGSEEAERPAGEAGQDQAPAEQAPVDMAHLARYTLGDAALEREVLELFCTQSVSYLERLRAAATQKDVYEAAHSLKGSARAVGAWRMAQAAEQVETLREDLPPEQRAARIGALEASLAEATAFIARLSDAERR